MLILPQPLLCVLPLTLFNKRNQFFDKVKKYVFLRLYGQMGGTTVFTNCPLTEAVYLESTFLLVWKLELYGLLKTTTQKFVPVTIHGQVCFLQE